MLRMGRKSLVSLLVGMKSPGWKDVRQAPSRQCRPTWAISHQARTTYRRGKEQLVFPLVIFSPVRGERRDDHSSLTDGDRSRSQPMREEVFALQHPNRSELVIIIIKPIPSPSGNSSRFGRFEIFKNRGPFPCGFNTDRCKVMVRFARFETHFPMPTSSRAICST